MPRAQFPDAQFDDSPVPPKRPPFGPKRKRLVFRPEPDAARIEACCPPPFNAGRGRSSPLRALSHAGAKRRHDPESLPAPPHSGGGQCLGPKESPDGPEPVFFPPAPLFFPAPSLSLHPRRRPPFVGCCASAHRQGMPSAARPGWAQATARRRRLTIDPAQRLGQGVGASVGMPLQTNNANKRGEPSRPRPRSRRFGDPQPIRCGRGHHSTPGGLPRAPMFSDSI